MGGYRCKEMGKRVYGLKRATNRMKLHHMRFMLTAREEIAQSQAEYQEEICPRCSKPMGVRPVWMIGKYDICYGCYQDLEAKKDLK